jgi:hypothetical protein
MFFRPNAQLPARPGDSFELGDLERGMGKGRVAEPKKTAEGEIHRLRRFTPIGNS